MSLRNLSSEIYDLGDVPERDLLQGCGGLREDVIRAGRGHLESCTTQAGFVRVVLGKMKPEGGPIVEQELKLRRIRVAAKLFWTWFQRNKCDALKLALLKGFA